MLGIKELIESAQKAHPAFRYATAVAGVAAIIVLFSRFGISWATLSFGVVVVIGLMTLFFAFARLSRLSDASVALPAKAILWSVVALSIAALGLLFSSTFFDYPLPLRSLVIGRVALPSPSTVPAHPADRVRVALVVANWKYKNFPLVGPDNDRRLVETTLRTAGFRVKVLPNGTKQMILEAWKEIETVSTYGGVALLYYSGHGFRKDGEDVILPIDAELRGDLSNTIRVSALMRSIAALDGKLEGASGEIVLYSTAPGGMAVDVGPDGKTSPFASAFATAVADTKGDIRDVFARVSSETKKATGGDQVPWISGSFSGRFDLSDRMADKDIGILRLIVFDAARP